MLRLADKIGSEFQFDSGGRLVEMVLAPEYRVRYQYEEKRVSWRSLARLPYRIVSEGPEQVEAAGAKLPRRLRLHDAVSGAEQVFEFRADHPSGRIGYTAQANPGGDDRFLAVLDDSSFLLKREGSTVAFDPAGRFTQATQITLGRMTQVPHEVRFNYELASRGFRVSEAQVFDQSKNQPIYQIGYSYGQDGDLLRTLVAPATAVGATR